MHLRPTIEMRSEKGPVRENNEDSMSVLQAPETRPGIDALYVVADGLGGQAHGEVASAMAVDLLLQAYHAGDTQEPPLTPSSIEASLTDTLRDINERIHEAGTTGEGLHRDPFRAGMATTVTTALLAGDAIYLGHVGDSRAYLLRQGQLIQLTEDHSLVAEQVRRGLIRPEEAERHPMRNVLTQTVGLGQAIVPFTTTQPLEQGDRLLLCSDGLNGFLGDQAIADIIEESQGENTVDALIEAAIAAGGTDNVTVLLVTFDTLGEEPGR